MERAPGGRGRNCGSRIRAQCDFCPLPPRLGPTRTPPPRSPNPRAFALDSDLCGPLCLSARSPEPLPKPPSNQREPEPVAGGGLPKSARSVSTGVGCVSVLLRSTGRFAAVGTFPRFAPPSPDDLAASRARVSRPGGESEGAVLGALPCFARGAFGSGAFATPNRLPLGSSESRRFGCLSERSGRTSCFSSSLFGSTLTPRRASDPQPRVAPCRPKCRKLGSFRLVPG